ncbi:unnamed protein product [Sphagnum tenellum]
MIGVGASFHLPSSRTQEATPVSSQPAKKEAEATALPPPTPSASSIQPSSVVPTAPIESPSTLESQIETISQITEVEKTERGLKLKLSGDLNFAPGSTQLSSAGEKVLTQIGQSLAKTNYSAIRVQGYTDTSGRLQINRKLSQLRAEKVRQILIDNGVKSELITAKGFGPEHPIQSNATKEGRALNRRVEIYVDETKL